MKNIGVLTIMVITFVSCDPVSNMDADIENLTPQTLIIDFISSDTSLSKTLQLPPNEMVRFQEGFDVGGAFLEPYLDVYDSVLIKNQLEETLRVYKEGDTGKNIYKIDDYWEASEPSKRFYKYAYEIQAEDIE